MALAEKWLEECNGSISATLDLATTCQLQQGFLPVSSPGSTSSLFHLHAEPQFEVGIIFSSPPPTSASDTASSLQSRLFSLSLDSLPCPGLVINGWKVKPMTGVSSFVEGVKIKEFADARISLEVSTTAFCLSGQKVRQEPIPADAGMPAGSYFQLRREIPLSISILNAPISLLG